MNVASVLFGVYGRCVWFDVKTKMKEKKMIIRSKKERVFWEREREIVSAGGLVLRKIINLEVFILYINS